MTDNIIPFPVRPHEEGTEELDDVNRQMLDLVGFALGIAEFWPEGIKFIPPTPEEVELYVFEASFYNNRSGFTDKKMPPIAWKKTAEARLRELRIARAAQCGYQGSIGFLD